LTSTGWSAVRDKCREFGDEFDEWQDGAGRAILAKRKDGIYAATVGGVTLSIPRQVAKTFLVGRILFALCVLFPGLKVLWTAHRTRTATNTFRSLQGYARRRKVAPHIKHIRTANGEQEIAFRNGSVIMFGAREQGFGRGFDEVDIEVFDEAQILTEKALEDMIAATNQARHPHGALLFFMGTPPRPVDPGEAFTIRRAKALSGKAEDMVYIEFSADHDADPDDRDQWAKANPSYPHRTPLESMLRLRENLPSDEAWKREALGIWDPVASKGVIPAPSWMDQADEHSLPAERFALGIEVGPDLAWASVALAGQRADSDWHVELDDDQHTRGRGVAWLTPHVTNLVKSNPQIRAVVADVGGPIKPLLVERNGRWFLKDDAGKPGVVEITPMKVAELGAGCSMVLNGIVTGSLWHLGQPQLTAAALAAGKRPLGDTGMWVWSRKTAESDITPIQAGTYALVGAQNLNVKKPGRSGAGRRSSGSRRAVVV
jgi:phage terminase large subunit-like protein